MVIISMVQEGSFGTEVKIITNNEKINRLKKKAFFIDWIYLLLKTVLSELEEGSKKLYTIKTHLIQFQFIQRMPSLPKEF